MKLIRRDIVAAIFAVTGAVVFFAKLQSYSWWLIGSWKGALGVLAVLGTAILVTYITDLLEMTYVANIAELLLWLAAATMVIAGLLSTTSRAEFVSSAIFIGLAWLAQLAGHNLNSSHNHGTHHHYVPAH